MIKASEEFKKLKEIANKIFKEYNEKNKFDIRLDFKSFTLNCKKVTKDILSDNNIILNDGEIEMLVTILRSYKYNNHNVPNKTNHKDNIRVPIKFNKEQLETIFEKTGYSKDACILACLGEYNAFEDIEEGDCLLRTIMNYLNMKYNVQYIIYNVSNLEDLISIDDVSYNLRIELFDKKLKKLITEYNINKDELPSHIEELFCGEGSEK